MSKSLPVLLSALTAHLALVEELLPEARERLSEVSVQKINSTVSDLVASVTAVQEEAPDDLGLPPFVTDLIADFRSAMSKREANDAAMIAATERQAVALEAIRDKLDGLTGSGGLLSKFLG